jgi:hypothetical protein
MVRSPAEARRCFFHTRKGRRQVFANFPSTCKTTPESHEEKIGKHSPIIKHAPSRCCCATMKCTEKRTGTGALRPGSNLVPYAVVQGPTDWRFEPLVLHYRCARLSRDFSLVQATQPVQNDTVAKSVSKTWYSFNSWTRARARLLSSARRQHGVESTTQHQMQKRDRVCWYAYTVML